MANVAISDIQNLSTSIEGEDLFLISKKNLDNGTYNSAKIKASSILSSIRTLDFTDPRASISRMPDLFKINGVAKYTNADSVDFENLDSSADVIFDSWVVPYSGLFICSYKAGIDLPWNVWNDNSGESQQQFGLNCSIIIHANSPYYGLHWHALFDRVRQSSVYPEGIVHISMIDCEDKSAFLEKGQTIYFYISKKTEYTYLQYINRTYLIPYKYN